MASVLGCGSSHFRSGNFSVRPTDPDSMNDSHQVEQTHCGCGCPELYADHDAPADRRIVITDDFGQRVQMSADQLRVLVAGIKSGVLELIA